MVENLQAIKNLTSDDLLFAKKMVSFFELLGITQNDLALLMQLVNEKDKIIKTMNQIIADQKVINQKIESLAKTIEEMKSKGTSAYKKDKFDPISELNKSALMFNKGI